MEIILFWFVWGQHNERNDSSSSSFQRETADEGSKRAKTHLEERWEQIEEETSFKKDVHYQDVLFDGNTLPSFFRNQTKS